MAREAILGSKKFATLHRARVRTGTFLYVPKNVEVALPLEAFHWLSGVGAFDAFRTRSSSRKRAAR